jgi:hypothetical protein
MKFKKGDFIMCCCKGGEPCGVQGTFDHYDENDGLIFYTLAEKMASDFLDDHWYTKEEYEIMTNTPLAKAMNESED